jgi:translation initiation factor IF-3
MSKRKTKRTKAKQVKVVVKKSFGPQTDDHDYEFKKNMLKILEEGSKLKTYVFFKGTFYYL